MQENFIENKCILQEWRNPEKGRYYAVMVCQDLFENWVITKIWGGNKKLGRKVTTLCDSHADAILQFNKVSKIREKHGYFLCRL